MFLILLTSLTFAQDRGVAYKKETEIDFEALDIDGEVIKPHGVFMQAAEDIKFNPLIELRSDWDDEMIDSVREIR